MTQEQKKKKRPTKNKSDSASKDLPEQIRLNKFLAGSALGSRRSVESYITQGRIIVNGRVVTDLAKQVRPRSDKVFFDGEEVRYKTKFHYIILNKPTGYICSKSDPQNRPTIYSLLPEKFQHLAYAGRLDLNSRGLVFLSNDGAVINQLSHPSFKSPKYYRVRLKEKLESIHKLSGILRKGVWDNGELLRVKDINLIEAKVLTISLVEGKKRHIRRMFARLRLTVRDIYRYGFGNLVQGDLQIRPGEFISIKKKDILAKNHYKSFK